MTTTLDLTQDPSSVYYMPSCDNLAMKLSPFLFDGERYRQWKRYATLYLSAMNKFCFVDGTLEKPVETDPSFSAWERCNCLVIGWLLSSVSTAIGDSVMFYETAREAWVDLEERFGQASSAELFSLYYELRCLKQTTENIAEFFTKIKSIWNEIDYIRPLPVCKCTDCTCSLTDRVKKRQENERLMVFLMKIKDEYDTVRTNILMMEELPSLNQAYRMLVDYELIRNVNDRMVQNDSTSGNGHGDEADGGVSPALTQEQYQLLVGLLAQYKNAINDQAKY